MSGRIIYRLHISLERLYLDFFEVFGGITQLMDPAALVLRVRIDHVDSCDESF